MRRVTADLDVALAMLRQVALGRATSVVGVPGGEVVLHRDFPAAHDHNKALVSGPCRADELAAAVEQVFLGAGLEHRLVEVHAAGALPAGLPGYAADRQLVMGAVGPPARTAPPGPVEVLAVDERARVATASWRQDNPDWDEDVLRQLGERVRTLSAAADATFLAVRDEAGRVVARADVYVRDGVAQVEDVNTDLEHRGRGLASRLVLEGVRLGRRSGAGLVFLVADEDDWPQHLYRRLGFADLGALTALTATRPRS